MHNRGLIAAAVVLAGALAGCSDPEPVPTPTPVETMAMPAEIQAFLDAAAAGDAEAARAHIVIWNEQAGELTGSQISLQCAQDEVAQVGDLANDEGVKIYVSTRTVTAGGPPTVRFEQPDGSSVGYGIEQQEGDWYWQPQAVSCRELWTSSPSLSPS